MSVFVHDENNIINVADIILAQSRINATGEPNGSMLVVRGTTGPLWTTIPFDEVKRLMLANEKPDWWTEEPPF